MRHLLVALLVALTAIGCEHPEQTTDEPSPPDAPEAASFDAEALVAQVERLRDREFDAPPSFERVTELDAAPSLSAQAREERRLLAEALFGVDADALAGAAPFGQLAACRPADHTIAYVDAEPERLERAVIAATVDCLDAQQLEGASAPAASWDAHLARMASTHADVMAVLVARALEAKPAEVGLARLAERPELVAHLPGLAPLLALDAPAGGDAFTAERIAGEEAAFALREGWSLAAALHRAGGWSGIELARLQPPRRSADVVRPDRWLAGEGIGQWTPAGDPPAPQAVVGQVGPALTALWLAQGLDPRAARTVYAGWTADAYRHSRTAQGDWAFEWVTQWDTPHSAKQVAAAFEAVLASRAARSGAEPLAYVVVHGGLKVAVVLSTQTDAARLTERSTQLLDSEFRFAPREPMPLAFVPSRTDELVEALSTDALDEARWRAPKLGTEMDLSALSDWEVQKAEHPGVQWFARHDDGSVVQLTAELADPFGPDFGSEPYRQRLVEAFESSVAQATIDAPTEAGDDRIVLRVTGQVDGQPRTIQLWHVRRGDVRWTYSLQAPPQAFEARLAEAGAAVASWTLPEQRPSEAAEKGDGILEFRVEEPAE